jgi:hypothetical protein
MQEPVCLKTVEEHSGKWANWSQQGRLRKWTPSHPGLLLHHISAGQESAAQLIQR